MVKYPILLQPWSWKIVSTIFPPDQPVVTNLEHWKWSQQHQHGHPHREVLIALKGTCYYRLKDKVYPCQPGTIIMFDAWEEHDDYYAPGTDKAVHLWFNLVEEHMFARILMVRNGQIQTSRSLNWLIHDADYRTFLSRRWTEAVSQGPGTGGVGRYKLLAALMNVVYHVAEIGDKEGELQGVPQLQKQVVDTIKDHIRENAGRGLSLENLARIAGYSKFHFLRVFKKYAGQSVHDYINTCRLHKARALQKSGRIKKEIAVELGFSCLAAFSRWYKDIQADGKAMNI